MSVTRDAIRDSFHIDRSLTLPFSGALRALPVAAMFAFGLAIGSPRTAVTLAVGGNLIAVISLVGRTRTTLGVLLVDAAGVGFATFLGSITASDTPLHLVVLSVWCFLAGSLVVLGPGPSTAGLQTVITFVVFGRFVDPPLGALELGVLVSLGAAIESIALLALRLPPTLRAQQVGLARAFSELAELGRRSRPEQAVLAGEALDDAMQLLSTPALFGRSDAQALHGLIDEGFRIRLELIAITNLRQRPELATDGSDAEHLENALQAACNEIESLATSLRGTRPVPMGPADGSDPDPPNPVRTEVVEQAAPADIAASVVRQYFVHLGALEGQLRAARRLIESAEPRSRTNAPRASRKAAHSRSEAWTVLASELGLVRSTFHLSSPAMRHSIRLAIAVPGSLLLADALGLPRGYWVAFTVSVVLRPDYSTLFRRGLGRVVGTVVGATITALVVGGLHPDNTVVVILVAITAWASYAVWQAGFSMSVAFVTSLILLFLSVLQYDTISTAADRLIDTLIGGAIALGIYVVWPTWSDLDGRRCLGDLIRAIRAYLDVTLRALGQAEFDAAPIAEASRATRIAWTNAQATIGRSMDEPASHRIDPALSSGTLSAVLRIVRATHALRAEAQRHVIAAPPAGLAELRDAFTAALGAVADQIATGQRAAPAAQLRNVYRGVTTQLRDLAAPPVIALEFDEVVDAINTLTAIATERAGPSS